MEWYVWAWFIALIVGLLILDLLMFQRRPHEVSTREAAWWSVLWVGLGLAFAVVLLFWKNADWAGEYLAGYLIEKSLSVDNLFVFAVIFSYFAVPAAFQHRVLFWGIFGALVLRLGFILAGVALLETFHATIFVFGAFLIFTAYKMWRHSGVEIHPEDNPVIRLVRRVFPMTQTYEGAHLFVRHGGKLMATPLLAVLVMVETSDVVFAVDSIPAVFAVTREPFIVFTSNAFAILGLRALYFVLASSMRRFRYLNAGLALILAFVGSKMLLSDVFHIPVVVSLAVIGVVLTLAIVASLRAPEQPEADEVSHVPIAGVLGGLAERHESRASQE